MIAFIWVSIALLATWFVAVLARDLRRHRHDHALGDQFGGVRLGSEGGIDSATVNGIAQRRVLYRHDSHGPPLVVTLQPGPLQQQTQRQMRWR